MSDIRLELEESRQNGGPYSSGEGGQERGRERGSGRATEVLRGNERV